MALPKTKKRCTGAGRRPALEELENVLFDQIVEMRTRKMKVSRSLLRGFAHQLAQEAGLSDFKASSTWCTLFMRRFKLSLRRVTNLTTLTDSQLVQRSVDYMIFFFCGYFSYIVLIRANIGLHAPYARYVCKPFQTLRCTM